METPNRAGLGLLTKTCMDRVRAPFAGAHSPTVAHVQRVCMHRLSASMRIPLFPNPCSTPADLGAAKAVAVAVDPANAPMEDLPQPGSGSREMGAGHVHAEGKGAAERGCC